MMMAGLTAGYTATGATNSSVLPITPSNSTSTNIRSGGTTATTPVVPKMYKGKAGDIVLSPLFSPLSFSGCSDDNMTKRQKIVKEIFESEQTYISQLNTVVKLFLEPIRINSLIPMDGIIGIFNNIEGILAVNTELLRTMRQHSVGEAFTHLGPFMKLYSSYSSNYHSALQVLEKYVKTDSNFAGFIETQEAKPECCYLNLAALLITPIQRIPRYKLLLNDLLKHTKVTHLEYSKLNAAVQQIEVVAAHMNDYIKQLDNSKKMLVLQKKFSGSFIPDIVTPGRQFIKEGRLMKICKRKPKERVVFLFSDMLLYARPSILDIRTETYSCRGFLPLLSSELHSLNKDIRVPGITALFQIVSAEKSVTFFSYRKEEVEEWLEVIENAVRELQLAFASFIIPSSSANNTSSTPISTIGGTIGSTTVRNIGGTRSIGETTSSRIPLDSNNIYENTYPLTPGTPISNLAESRFFVQDRSNKFGTGMGTGIPTATELVHHQTSNDSVPAGNSMGRNQEEPAYRTISQTMRELRAITEGDGLMNEIESEITHRREDDRTNLIGNNEPHTPTGSGDMTQQLKNSLSSAPPLTSTPMQEANGGLNSGVMNGGVSTARNKNDGGNISMSSEEKSVVSSTSGGGGSGFKNKEQEELPLLENSDAVQHDTVSQHSSSSTGLSGGTTTTCCIII